MKKIYFLVFLIVTFVFLSGCITTRRVKKPRVDQEMAGNVGYVEGEESVSKTKKLEDTVKDREYFEVDIEVPPLLETRDHHWKDDEISGNAGYVIGKPKVNADSR